MQTNIEIKIVAYYFDVTQIQSFLKDFSCNIDIVQLKQLRSPELFDCMDLTAYYKIYQEKHRTHVILLNDTIFKKYFWKTSLKSLIRLVKHYSIIDDIPILIGDVHKSADLYSGYHPAGRHVSTYAFYANKPAQNIFMDIYESYQDRSFDELTLNPFVNVLNIRNFKETDSAYAWRRSSQITSDTHLRKLKAILIELGFSNAVFSNGIIIDIKDSLINRILYKLRGILNK